MIKTKLALAATIVLGSAVVGTAQAQYYDYLGGPVGARSYGAPPTLSELPFEAGGGSVGYNENLRRDEW